MLYFSILFLYPFSKNPFIKFTFQKTFIFNQLKISKLNIFKQLQLKSFKKSTNSPLIKKTHRVTLNIANDRPWNDPWNPITVKFGVPGFSWRIHESKSSLVGDFPPRFFVWYQMKACLIAFSLELVPSIIVCTCLRPLGATWKF